MDDNTIYSLEFLTSALQDMTEIISSYIISGSKKGALRIKKKFDSASKQIQSFPYSGIKVPDDKLSKSGFRMIIIEKYLMFYKVFEDDRKIIIYHVFNGTRNYPSLMNRISNPDE